MSVVVDLDELAKARADFGSAYLLTVSAEGRVKAVTVDPEVGDGVVTVPGGGVGGGGTARNLAANPAVTLVFWPRQPQGFSLIVDGTAVATDAGFEVTPTHAVLHRPAAHADTPTSPGGCGNDCSPVGS